MPPVVSSSSSLLPWSGALSGALVSLLAAACSTPEFAERAEAEPTQAAPAVAVPPVVAPRVEAAPPAPARVTDPPEPGSAAPLPAGTCAEPPAAEWLTVTGGRTEATVVWKRVATEGCVDTFQPSGTARVAPQHGCTFSSHAVDPGEGVLVIDRSTAPPTFRVRGASHWQATRRCALPDGTVTRTPVFVGGAWAAAEGLALGDRFSGSFRGDDVPVHWRFMRL